jgi:hypothetical protein
MHEGGLYVGSAGSPMPHYQKRPAKNPYQDSGSGFVYLDLVL